MGGKVKMLSKKCKMLILAGTIFCADALLMPNQVHADEIHVNDKSNVCISENNQEDVNKTKSLINEQENVTDSNKSKNDEKNNDKKNISISENNQEDDNKTKKLINK